MVPEKRTRARHWHFQRWNKYWRDSYSVGCAADCQSLGMARRVRQHWRVGVLVASSLAEYVPQARGTPFGHDARACAHSKRSRAACQTHKMVGAFSPATDVGARGREAANRSRVVVLPFLAAKLLATQAWPHAEADRDSNPRCVFNFGCGQC